MDSTGPACESVGGHQFRALYCAISQSGRSEPDYGDKTVAQAKMERLQAQVESSRVQKHSRSSNTFGKDLATRYRTLQYCGWKLSR